MRDIVDTVNRRTMCTRRAVKIYAARDELYKAEVFALSGIREQAAGKRILDIGVGAGRTTRGLREISQDYLGIDYAQPMVDAASSRHPGVEFRRADARDMAFLPDSSIFLAVFSCGGICMVGHEDRLKILREIYRVLAPGGGFLLSTLNQRSPDCGCRFLFPEIKLCLNPARMLVRSVRFAGKTAWCALNHLRFSRHNYRSADYSIVNDIYHDYSVMLYYITIDAQRRQLAEAGFLAEADAWDNDGKIERDTHDPMMTFLARKAYRG
jgi:ubiquinone/menaquinone biosynthesis C-methylase UbiE